MSNTFRAASAAVSAAVLIATGFTGDAASAAPARTAEGWDDCAQGHFCMWEEPTFGGEKVVDWVPHRRERLTIPPSAQTNSVRNNSNIDVLLNNHPSGRGYWTLCIWAHAGHGDLRLLGWGDVAKSAGTTHCTRTYPD